MDLCHIDLRFVTGKGKLLSLLLLILSVRADAAWGEVQRREQPPEPYIVLPSGDASGSLSRLPPNPTWGLIEIDRATDLQAAAALAPPSVAPVFQASSQDPWTAAKPWTVVTPRSSSPGLDVVPLTHFAEETHQAEGRSIDDYSDEEEDQLPIYRPVYTVSNKVNAGPSELPTAPATVEETQSMAPVYEPPPAPVFPSPSPGPAPTPSTLDPSAPLPLPPNPPPQQNLPTPAPQLLSSNPLTRLKQGLRSQIESVPHKLFNVATRQLQPKKNVPKNYNTLVGEATPYQPQQSHLDYLSDLLENVKIPTVYGKISPRLPNLQKPPSLQNFLYGNQGSAPHAPDPVHPIYPSYPTPAQDPYASYGVNAAKQPFPSPELQASVGELKNSVKQSLSAVNSAKQSLYSLVTSIPKVKVPTFLPITKGKGEWSEGAQTFWQYVIGMLGIAVFLAIQI